MKPAYGIGGRVESIKGGACVWGLNYERAYYRRTRLLQRGDAVKVYNREPVR